MTAASRTPEEIALLLKKYPELLAPFSQLLDAVENNNRKLIRADDAEEAMINGARELGIGLMEAWGKKRALEEAASAQADKRLKKHSKKDHLA